MSDKGQKRECQGCIGFSDEHTCDGWADFQSMKRDKDQCQNCKRLTARLEANERAIESYQNDEAGILAENERLRAALVRAYDLVKLGRYQMADNELREAIKDKEPEESSDA